MITLDRASVYDRAFYGEPLERAVRPRSLSTERGWWIIGDWALLLPQFVVRPAPDIQRMTAELRGWTSWSSRRLADVLGTSHTTVLRIESGRPLISGHSGDLRRRLADAHEVVGRVFLLTGRDPGATGQVLDTSPPDGTSPVAALHERQPAKAYLSAIDVLRPRTAGLLVGTRARREGATAPLHE